MIIITAFSTQKSERKKKKKSHRNEMKIKKKINENYLDE